jgi:hypothetical protein
VAVPAWLDRDGDGDDNAADIEQPRVTCLARVSRGYVEVVRLCRRLGIVACMCVLPAAMIVRGCRHVCNRSAVAALKYKVGQWRLTLSNPR